jgi:hypothetical protein
MASLASVRPRWTLLLTMHSARRRPPRQLATPMPLLAHIVITRVLGRSRPANANVLVLRPSQRTETMEVTEREY